jgi:alpha-beta hydrolase superfamily lysophospholipase
MDQASFTDADGIEVGYRRWQPSGPATAVVLVLHGASEHGGRYDRFARALTGEGWAVYAPDHRGHGLTSTSTGRGIVGPRGFDGVVDDVEELRRLALAKCGDVPVLMFAHSMGSIIGFGYVQRYGAGLSACVLSGAIGVADGMAELAEGLRQAAEAGMAGEPMDALAPFNEPFEPSRTRYDWLSRDPDEVDKYIADPDCGDDLPLTYGFVAEMLRTASLTTPEAIASVPRELPFLLVTGDQDPVSNGGAQVRELDKRLRDQGIAVDARYYEGARHEVLNETNRDEVTSDVVEFFRSHANT